MALDPVHQFLVERIDPACDAEGAVAQVAAGAAGDLAEFCGGELAELVAVELAVLREGDVIDVEVQPHADGVGRHQIVDVAVLVERDLRVAGAGRQRAQHHGRPALLAADQFGDGVDLVGREGDDRAAARQPCQLLGAGIGEVRQPRPRHHGHALEQLLQYALHGGRTQQQRLLPATQV